MKHLQRTITEKQANLQDLRSQLEHLEFQNSGEENSWQVHNLYENSSPVIEVNGSGNYHKKPSVVRLSVTSNNALGGNGRRASRMGGLSPLEEPSANFHKSRPSIQLGGELVSSRAETASSSRVGSTAASSRKQSVAGSNLTKVMDMQVPTSTKEDMMDLELHLKQMYDLKLAKSLERVKTQISFERNEMVRLNDEFHTRFLELTNDMARDNRIINTLTSGKHSILSKIGRIFPFDKAPGRNTVGVQCDIEPPQSRQWKTQVPVIIN